MQKQNWWWFSKNTYQLWLHFAMTLHRKCWKETRSELDAYGIGPADEWVECPTRQGVQTMIGRVQHELLSYTWQLVLTGNGHQPGLTRKYRKEKQNVFNQFLIRKLVCLILYRKFLNYLIAQAQREFLFRIIQKSLWLKTHDQTERRSWSPKINKTAIRIFIYLILPESICIIPVLFI